MRTSKPRLPFRPSYAMVVDGETEVWYFQMLKQYEGKYNSIRLNIKPEIPQKKDLKSQFELVKELSGAEFNRVYWIVDFDTILKETREVVVGAKTPIKKFVEYRSHLLKYNPNVNIIVNNPCLEYWFLLHFHFTGRLFDSCSKVEQELVKKIPGYEKTERFFKKNGCDIYTRLKPLLLDAIQNAGKLDGFDDDDPEKAMCEMDDFFNFILN